MSKIAAGINIVLITLVSFCFFPTHQSIGALRQKREISNLQANSMYSNAGEGYGCTATAKADSRIGEKLAALIPRCAKTSLVASSIDATISIDTSTKHQKIDGFGFFGAMDTWWGKPEGLVLPERG